MANVYLEASAAVGTAAGYQNRASKIQYSGSAAVNTVGTIELKQNGAAGSTVWKVFVDGGKSSQCTIPNIQFDYVTISNAVCTVEFYKAHGKA
jgi:hypothetical protein